jgi:ABC-type transporter Mla MlaB component
MAEPTGDQVHQSSELKVVCAWSEHDFIATLEGTFAGDAATHFGEILLLESWRGLDRIALDVSGVRAVDLFALALLWRVAESALALGGVLELQSPSTTLRERMDAFGLTPLVHLGPSDEVRCLLGEADSRSGS